MSYLAGRKHGGKGLKFNDSSGVDGISLPPSETFEDGYGSTQDDHVIS